LTAQQWDEGYKAGLNGTSIHGFHIQKFHIDIRGTGQKVSRVNNDRTRRTTNVRGVLLHVFGEDLYHRGEIIAILWQIKIQPPDMGWLSVMKKTNLPWRMT